MPPVPDRCRTFADSFHRLMDDTWGSPAQSRSDQARSSMLIRMRSDQYELRNRQRGIRNTIDKLRARMSRRTRPMRMHSILILFCVAARADVLVVASSGA